MATIEDRGDFQYRVRIRRKGVSRSKTFETYREAEEWALRMDGKIAGDELADDREARGTTLQEAVEWYMERIAPTDPVTGKRRFKKQHDKNLVSCANYWILPERWKSPEQEAEFRFRDWSLLALKPMHLIEWRRAVLDEDNAEDGSGVGPDADCAAQTALHRLNLLSELYNTWNITHAFQIANPVTKKVRPPVANERKRRLFTLAKGDVDEEKKLFEAAEKSSRPWLKPAIILALETCMRQAELAGLEWNRVWLEGDEPHAYLPYTKNDRARSVPLSTRAVAAFRTLLPPHGRKPRDGRVFPVQTPRAFGHAFRDVVKEKDFPDLRWHDLRHEGISRLFERTDLRETEIMSISGHLRHEMLIRYTHLRTPSLAKRLG